MAPSLGATDTFGLVVVQWAGCGALGAGPTGQVFMGQIDVDLLGLQPQVYGGHIPGVFDAQNTAVKFSIFHPHWMDVGAIRCTGPGQRGDAQGGFSGAL